MLPFGEFAWFGVTNVFERSYRAEQTGQDGRSAVHMELADVLTGEAMRRLEPNSHGPVDLGPAHRMPQTRQVESPGLPFRSGLLLGQASQNGLSRWSAHANHRHAALLLRARRQGIDRASAMEANTRNHDLK